MTTGKPIGPPSNRKDPQVEAPPEVTD